MKDSWNQTKDTVLFTNGFADGSLQWSEFEIKTFSCNYSNGKIHIPGKGWPEKGNMIIDISCINQPENNCLTSIPKNYIINTEFFPQNTFKKAPGNSIRLGIRNTYDNLSIETLKKKSEVDEFFSACNVLVTGGEYENGFFNITENVFDIEFNTAGIIGEPTFDPSLSDTFSLQLDYIDDYKFTVYGRSGFNGSSGSNGSFGSDGGCYGCCGSDGQNGESGYNGEDGDRGPDVDIEIVAYYDTILNTELCFVTIEDLDNQNLKYFIVNPNGGSLRLLSEGGDGGSGGNGGHGGSGGHGGNGESYTIENKKYVTITDTTGTHIQEIIETVTVTEPGGNGGRGGSGGHGGNGGYGGDGGNIFVYYTDSAYPYLSCFSINSTRGMGGSSGSGGHSGSGGAGGSGNPSGSNGSSGFSGTSGWSGDSGREGDVIYNNVTK